eukprot:TRINITY_DN6930_c0_g1_i5.p1 TRINITY_DN6930_c0_g1~~TRINITY_DN6930_c0_g1_i5.p1  ORF type:complete len:902 (+),score=185.91 TRINITY_DN6930_c0_g1_i5:73-2778(+)
MASPQQNPQDGEYAEEAQSPLPSECAGGGDEGSNVNSWDAPCASPSPGFFSENGCPESNPGASRGNGGPAQSRHTMLHGRSVRKHSQSCASAEAAEPKEEKKQGHFVDAAAMKERVRARIAKPKYDVSIYYKDYGVWPVIAKDANFEKATLFVIITNALWIAADTNYNKHELLYQAKPVFQIAENLFCAFFGFEWFVRMMSFRRKLDGLRDAWFVFDGTMVTVMIFETWAFTLVVINTQQDGAVPGTQIVRFARIMRLSRMCRMARLLRAMPELFVMIKGLFAAARSVFFTLVLLAVLLLIFAIAFKQLTFNTKLGDDLFPNIGQGMYVLLVHGTLLLSADVKAKQIVTEGGPLLEAFFFLFILFAAILLMNMLIGVLCEVVSYVAGHEKEAMLIALVQEKMTEVMVLIDEDGGGTISRDEFMQILDQSEAVECLQEVGVDVVGLVDCCDFIFGDEGESAKEAGEEAEEVELTLPEFMEVVLSLRGTNNATVKDMVDFRKLIRTAQVASHKRLDCLELKWDTHFSTMRENMDLLSQINKIHAESQCLLQSWNRGAEMTNDDGTVRTSETEVGDDDNSTDTPGQAVSTASASSPAKLVRPSSAGIVTVAQSPPLGVTAAYAAAGAAGAGAAAAGVAAATTAATLAKNAREHAGLSGSRLLANSLHISPRRRPAPPFRQRIASPIPLCPEPTSVTLERCSTGFPETAVASVPAEVPQTGEALVGLWPPGFQSFRSSNGHDSSTDGFERTNSSGGARCSSSGDLAPVLAEATTVTSASAASSVFHESTGVPEDGISSETQSDVVPTTRRAVVSNFINQRCGGGIPTTRGTAFAATSATAWRQLDALPTMTPEGPPSPTANTEGPPSPTANTEGPLSSRGPLQGQPRPTPPLEGQPLPAGDQAPA